MSLQKALHEALASIPDCVAVGAIDLASGELLGIRAVDRHVWELCDLVSVLPESQSVSTVFKKHKGLSDAEQCCFRELIVTSDELIHVFQRGRRTKAIVMVSICRVSANLGMALVHARLALGRVEQEV
ncbi:MAG: hypothetical protein JKY37_14520 [Nannocystaceae bacterium]|nr:hypothetical protein [Nannocystaceae bacterium]